MPVKRYWSARICFALVIWGLLGCGGGGAGVDSPVLTPTVAIIARPSEYWAADASVDDSGSILGGLYRLAGTATAAYWSGPARATALPAFRPDSSETLSGVSPDHRYYCGTSHLWTNSTNPRFGFVFDATKAKFLPVTLPDPSVESMMPASVTDDGLVSGVVILATRKRLRFIYDLASKTATTEEIPPPVTDLGTPSDASSRRIDCFSANGVYAAGAVTLNGEQLPVLWHVATRKVTFIEGAPSGAQAWRVSNDGSRVVLSSGGPVLTLWRNGRCQNMMELVQAAGIHEPWPDISLRSMSPNGKSFVLWGNYPASSPTTMLLTLP